MDLKRVQEELRKDILQHQALMEQMKRYPRDQTLNLKLKAVQKHIADLGSQQKKILLAARNSSGSSISAGGTSNAASAVAFLAQKVKAEGNNNNITVSNQNTLTQKVANENTASAYTLIPIKNRQSVAVSDALIPIKNRQPVAVPGNTNKAIPQQSNSGMPINLSRFASQGQHSKQNSAPSSTLIVVSSPNPISVSKQVVNQPQRSGGVPVSLASLVSTGGVVTLSGTWQGNAQSCTTVNNNTDTMGRLLPAKQVQIKVPVVQSPGSSPLILMQQNSAASQSKSLFRLLPKGRHPIPITPPQGIMSSGNQPTRPVTQTLKNPSMPQQQVNTIIMQNEPGNRPQPVQQVLVQRVGNLQPVSSQSSVTWQDLSSKTPSMHKPSYVPRKTFPNINNGVGAFQKFRILDGKAQILPKAGQQEASQHSQVQNLTMQSHSGAHDKPRNAALKAVLTSAKSGTAPSGMMALARLVPSSVPKNGFVPIQQQESTSSKAPPPAKTAPAFLKSAFIDGPNPFVPVPVTTASTAPIRPPSCNSNEKESEKQSLKVDEETKSKQSFLRNIDLIPKEQAEKVRGRRFRKRRNAANPIYSGGMYISNELEPKRICPDVVANAIESVTAPDVIVKRPRGRPRGSKNLSTTLRLQSSTRVSRGSPSVASNVEELRQLKGILDAVKSASKVSSPPVTPVKSEPEDLSTRSRERTIVRSSSPRKSVSPRSKTPDDEGDEHEDQCAICGKTGEVLMCDTCSRVYHLSCATPPLGAVPQGMWVCSKCKKEFKEAKPQIEWPGIASAVHSYADFNVKREKEIEMRREKLKEAKKIVAGLRTQTKSLTSVVMAKVGQRSKASREGQAFQKEIVQLSTMTQNIRHLVIRGKSTPI